MLEVCLFIRWNDGSETYRRYATCEEAWTAEREMKKKEHNRRAKEDRKWPDVSMYYGCTIHGNTYGGILSGRDSRDQLDTFKASERIRQGYGPKPPQFSKQNE